MSYHMATEQETDQALAFLKPIIEAANASNQNGEDAIVKVVRAYKSHDALVKAVDETRILISYLRRQFELSDKLDGINMAHVIELEPTIRAALAKATGAA